MYINNATSRLDVPDDVLSTLMDTSASRKSVRNPYTKEWSTEMHFNLDANGVFATGLWRDMRAWLKDMGHTVEVVDERVKLPCMVPSDPAEVALNGKTAFPFQLDTVRKGFRGVNCIVKASVAAGKSVCIFLMCETTPDMKWCVITDSKKVAMQLAGNYEKDTGEKAGRVIEGKWTHERVTFATYSQFRAKLTVERAKGGNAVQKLLQSYQGVLIDEVHTSAAASHVDVLMEMTGAYYRVGFSGSPFGRSDNKHEVVVGMAGPVAVDISSQDMQEVGRVAEVVARFVAHQHPPFSDYVRANEVWEDTYTRVIVENTKRNALLAAIVDVAAKPCLVFADRHAHINILAPLVAELGWVTKVVTGKVITQVAEEYMDGMRKGIVDVIVCNVVLNTGVDIPNIASIVIAGANRANIASVQRPGRAMRTAEGKDVAEYWDVADVGELEKQTKERAKHLRAENHSIEVISADDLADMKKLQDADDCL